MRRSLLAALACAACVTAPAAHAAVLTIPTAITVNGTDVFSGPTFTVSGNFAASDLFGLVASGEVGLATNAFFANAAGVITRPATTNTGHHPGETSPASAGATIPGAPYAALLVGNASLGFHLVFPADASTGLGSATPPTTLVSNRTISDIFGPGASIADGTELQFRVNDINTGDNSGGFRLSPVPEPATGLLLLAGLAGVARRRRQ